MDKEIAEVFQLAKERIQRAIQRGVYRTTIPDIVAHTNIVSDKLIRDGFVTRYISASDFWVEWISPPLNTPAEEAYRRSKAREEAILLEKEQFLQRNREALMKASWFD